MSLGLANLIGVMHRAATQIAGIPVEYRRGADAIQIQAKKLLATVDVDSGDGTIITAQRVDWIGATDDLVFEGEVTEPAAGDKVVELLGSKERTYEVMPVGTESHFEPEDPYQNEWRIHSKLTQTE